MTKSILILGGGEIGLNQVKWAKQAGFHVVVTDSNPSAPGLQRADQGVVVDATDVRGLLAFVLACKGTHDFRGVYCGNDFGVLSVAILAQALDLPHNPVAPVVRSLDKWLSKTCWRQAGIATPQGRCVETADDAAIIAHEFGFPLVVKPTAGSGSRGVRIVRDDAALRSVQLQLQQESRLGHLLVEQFIAGEHYDVNGLLWQGEFHGCGVMRRSFSAPPFCVPTGGNEPSGLPGEIEAGMYDLLERAVRALGIEFGPVKGDFVLDETGRVFIYEAAPRFHGDLSTAHTSAIARRMSPIKAFFHALHSGELDPEYLSATENAIGAWRVLNLQPGKLAAIHNLAAAGAGSGIEKVLLRCKAGDRVNPLRDNGDVPGFVWLSGQSMEQIDAAFAEFVDNIHVQYEPDLVRSDVLDREAKLR